MPRERPALIGASILSAAVLATAACTHVADVLTNTGQALRRHADQSNEATAGSGTATRSPAKSTGGATQAQFDDVAASIKAVREQCKASFATPELDPIRHKVVLWRDTGDEPLPFEIATNNDFPTADERPVIAKAATLRDECLSRIYAVPYIPPGANDTQTAMLKTVRSFGQQLDGALTELIISLYQQKLTYGEFGRKRQEVEKASAAFTLAMTQVGAGGGTTQHQLEELQGAQQQFTDTIDAFVKYVHSVSARKPKTVRLSGMGK
jgi:hypothetical protein